MTVSIDQRDRTWLMHVDGLLALLHEPHNNALRYLTLYRATQVLDNLTGLNSDEQDSGLTDSERTFLLLDLSKLRLKTQISDMEGLLASTDHPRQIDLQRIRGSVKRVYKDLATIPAQINAENSKFRVQRISAYN
jgi:hypothetical protein